MRNLSFSAEAEGRNCAVESSRGGHSLQRDRMEGQLFISLNLSALPLGCSLLVGVWTVSAFTSCVGSHTPPVPLSFNVDLGSRG